MKPLSRSARTICKRTEFATTPDRLFDAFVNPDVLTQWFAETAETDPRPRGTWCFDFGEAGGGRISGSYVLVQRPHRLVWTWNEWNIDEAGEPVSPDPSGNPPWAVTVCDISIVDLHDTTGLWLLHYGYPDMPTWDDIYHGVNTGWDVELEKLRKLIERQPDRELSVVQILAANASGARRVG
jgi:uncharacterized protein YndB with AHSA1/START domain